MQEPGKARPCGNIRLTVISNIRTGEALLPGLDPLFGRETEAARIEDLLRGIPAAAARRVLRLFAISCAESIAGPSPAADSFVAAARRQLAGRLRVSRRKQIIAQTAGACCAAGVIGLKHGCVGAAKQLAGRACLEPNARDAARAAARMELTAAALEVLNAAPKTLRCDIRKAIANAVRRRVVSQRRRLCALIEETQTGKD